MNVTAIIVTRGDVSLKPIMESLPEEWEKLVWSNGIGCYRWLEDIAGDDETKPTWQPKYIDRTDYSVYGRYVAIQFASHDLIYVQDDDVVVSDPQAIVNEWDRVALRQEQDPAGVPSDQEWGKHVVCNMPQEFRDELLHRPRSRGLRGGLRAVRAQPCVQQIHRPLRASGGGVLGHGRVHAHLRRRLHGPERWCLSTSPRRTSPTRRTTTGCGSSPPTRGRGRGCASSCSPLKATS